MHLTYKNLFAISTFFLAAAASAQSQKIFTPPADSVERESSTFKFRPPAGGSLNDCIKFIETDGDTGTNTITMANGEKIQFTRQSASEPALVKAIKKDGEILVEQNGLDRATKDLEEIPTEVAKDKNYVAVKARLHTAMANMIKKDCALFSAKKSFRNTKLPEVGVYDNPELPTKSQDIVAPNKDLIAHTDLVDNNGYIDPGMFSAGGDYGGSGGFGSGGAGYDGYGGYSTFSTGWSEQDFNDFASAFIMSDFAFNLNQFVTSNTLMPKCNEVIVQCTSFCQSMGAYEGTACVALGGAAAFLSGPIGVAVGAYCSGQVWIAMEQCKQSCLVVPVPCR